MGQWVPNRGKEREWFAKKGTKKLKDVAVRAIRMVKGGEVENAFGSLVVVYNEFSSRLVQSDLKRVQRNTSLKK